MLKYNEGGCLRHQPLSPGRERGTAQRCAVMWAFSLFRQLPLHGGGVAALGGFTGAVGGRIEPGAAAQARAGGSIEGGETAARNHLALADPARAGDRQADLGAPFMAGGDFAGAILAGAASAVPVAPA